MDITEYKCKLIDAQELLKRASNSISDLATGCSVNMDFGSSECGYCKDCVARNVLIDIGKFLNN